MSTPASSNAPVPSTKSRTAKPTVKVNIVPTMSTTPGICCGRQAVKPNASATPKRTDAADATTGSSPPDRIRRTAHSTHTTAITPSIKRPTAMPISRRRAKRRHSLSTPARIAAERSCGGAIALSPPSDWDRARLRSKNARHSAHPDTWASTIASSSSAFSPSMRADSAAWTSSWLTTREHPVQAYAAGAEDGDDKQRCGEHEHVLHSSSLDEKAVVQVHKVPGG